LEKALNTRIGFYHRDSIVKSIKQHPHFDTTHWRSVCDVSLTLKQAQASNDGRWFQGNEDQYRAAFRHFIRRLNDAVYGNAARRYGKRLRVIAVLEKELYRRWHYHAAIKPPSHVSLLDFEKLIHECWAKTHWGHNRVQVRDNADQGWIIYMLKPRQKSEFETWSDCIDWDSLHNPIADA
jgi:hypothetical protein